MIWHSDVAGSRRSVAITGVGIVSPIGIGIETFWTNARQGTSGLALVDGLASELVPAAWLGLVPHQSHQKAGSTLSLASVDARVSDFALIACSEAMSVRGLPIETAPDRRAVVVGTCQSSMGDSQAHRRTTPATLTDVIGAEFDLRGPRISVNTACSSGATAIAMGHDLVAFGDVDLALCGGVDAVSMSALEGFASMGLLSDGPCQPFSRSDGLSLGEGAAFLVLEPLNLVQSRAADRRFGLVLGYGLSADAHHLTAPDPTGSGQRLAVLRALRDANCGTNEIGHVNAHGSGTPANDKVERELMWTLFGERAPEIPMSATKSMTGHMLGASAALEAAVCALAVSHGEIPRTISLTTHQDGLDHVAEVDRPARTDISISNSYAFGGSNTSIVVGGIDRAWVADSNLDDRTTVAITGVGAAGLGGLPSGHEALMLALGAGRERTPDEIWRPASDPERPPIMFDQAKLWRRMDQFVRHAVLSCSSALENAGLSLAAEGDSVGLVVATDMGPYEAQRDLAAARKLGKRSNPALVASSAMTSTAGAITMALHLRGAAITISSGGVSGLAAMDCAGKLLKADRCSSVLVCAVESPPCQQPDDFASTRRTGTLGRAAVALVLERETTAAQRSAPMHATVQAYGMQASAGSECDYPTTATWHATLTATLTRSLLSPEDVGLCVAATSGLRKADEQEFQALRSVFPVSLPVATPKLIVGETLGAGGVVNVIAGIRALNTSFVAAPLGAHIGSSRKPPPTEELARPTNILVNAASQAGTSASVVLSRSGSW